MLLDFLRVFLELREKYSNTKYELGEKDGIEKEILQLDIMKTFRI